jgi:aspartate aminotransferase
MIWGTQPFHSPLQSYARSVSIYSFGKAFAIQGQRIGYIALSPRLPELDEARTAIERSARAMGFGHAASIMQRAVIDLLECRPTLTALTRNQADVRSALASYGYDVCEGGATFYAYVKSPLADDFRFAELLAAKGVLVVPSTLFHDPGYIRLSLTAPTKAIAAALPIFAAALDEARKDTRATCAAVLRARPPPRTAASRSFVMRSG